MNDTANLGRRAAAEAIGTFFLVFIGTGAIISDTLSGGAVGHVGIALAFGLAVLGMVYAVGHISGAHINPAVTIGFWAVGRFPGRDVLPYVAAHVLGAVLAAFALRILIGNVGVAGATVPAQTLTTPGAFGIEMILTFALMFVIIAVATDRRVPAAVAGLGIGLAVAFNALMGGFLTGASMNPARSFGPALIGGAWEVHWLYWLAPIAGACLAAVTYEAIRHAEAPWIVPRGIAVGATGPLERDAGTATGLEADASAD